MNADDQQTAREALRQYAVAPDGQHHRVTDEFLSIGSRYRPLIEAVSRGEAASEELMVGIRSIAHIRITG